MAELVKHHSKLSPSGISRWGYCPGSIEAEAQYPDVASRPAAEGTFAHYILLDLALPQGRPPHDFIGLKMTVEGFEFECTFEMAEHLLPIFDEIEAMPGKKYYEQKVSLDFWLPGQSGTADVICISETSIRVRDLKYGAGIPVRAEENEQAMGYMLGVMAWCKDQGLSTRGKELIVEIDQPRCAGGGGTWIVTRERLREFADWLEEAGKAALKPNAPRVPGIKQCAFCRAAHECRPLAGFLLAQAQLDFDDLDAEEPALPSIQSLTPAERARVFQHQKLFEKWLKLVHYSLLQDALAGRDAGGLKAVEGRAGRRTWDESSVEQAAIVLERNGVSPYAEPVLLSPAKAEGAIKKAIPARSNEGKLKRKRLQARLAIYISEGKPKPALVPEHDPKPALNLVDVEFDDLDDDGGD